MSRKRGNGEGCIHKLKDGRWEARIMTGYNEKGKPKFKTFSSKKRDDVSKKLADYISNQKASQPENICKGTLKEWLLRWLDDYVAKNVKISTRISYEGYVKHQLIPYLGGIKLSALKKTDIENMYEKLLTEGRADKKGGLSVKTVSNVALCLHKALQCAYENEYITKNPASIAKVPTLKSTNGAKKEVEILTKQEQKSLIAACDNSSYGMAIITALHTGLRCGELLGITWKDINFEQHKISISKQVSRLHDYSLNAKAKTKLDIYNYTKTNSSQRIVSMDNILASKLKNYKIIQDEQKKKWGKSYNDLDLVFAREDGNIIDPSTLRDKYMKFLKMAGLKHYKFHALRHTFASRALEANISIKVVSKILGHANVQITMDTYQHVVPELQSEAMNLIADYVAS